MASARPSDGPVHWTAPASALAMFLGLEQGLEDWSTFHRSPAPNSQEPGNCTPGKGSGAFPNVAIAPASSGTPSVTLSSTLHCLSGTESVGNWILRASPGWLWVVLIDVVF